MKGPAPQMAFERAPEQDKTVPLLMTLLLIPVSFQPVEAINAIGISSFMSCPRGRFQRRVV
jgi:hypothetical protein